MAEHITVAQPEPAELAVAETLAHGRVKIMDQTARPIQAAAAVEHRIQGKTAAQAAPALLYSKLTNRRQGSFMPEKIYMLYGIDTAMHLLRPGAKWEITNCYFSRWEDSRPCPTWQEVQDVMAKIKAFEDSINTVWLPEQIEALRPRNDAMKQVEEYVGIE